MPSAAERLDIRDVMAGHWDAYAAANKVFIPDTSLLCDPAE
jgi:hypothetical protein